MRIQLFIGIALIASQLANAEESIGKTLCAGTEKTVFSCQIKRKLLSICASENLSETAGYLKYRFGESAQKIELEYPRERTHPRNRFSLFVDHLSAKSSTEQLSFNVGKFKYIVFVERAAFDFNGSGVIIKLGEQQEAYLACNRERPSPDELYRLEGLNLPRVEYESFNE